MPLLDDETRRDAMQTATRPRPRPLETPPPATPEERPAQACPGSTGAEPASRQRRADRLPPARDQRQLPLRTRIVLGTAGGILVVLGIAGLFLPFLQGILFLVLAAAVLSLTSRRVYRWLQAAVGERWPHAWQRVERFRTRVRWKFRR